MTATSEPPDVAAIRAYGQAAEVLLAFAEARSGNPWPFIELQWGRVINPLDVLADRQIVRDLDRRGERYLILDGYQRDLIESVHDPSIREVYVKGNTGCGKGASAAIAICVYYAIWDDAKVVATRDTYRSAVRLFFGEIASWWRRMAFPPKRIELLTAGLVDRTAPKHELSMASPKADEGFAGAHSPHVFFVFDEGTSPNLASRYRLVDTQARKFLVLANPRVTGGPFWQAFHISEEPDKTQTVVGPMGRRRLITVDGEDMLNVKAKCLSQPVGPRGGITIRGKRFAAGEHIPDEYYAEHLPIIPGQTCYDEYLGLLANPDPDWVACYAHGRFPGEDKERQVIMGTWVVPCQDRWSRWNAALNRARERRQKWLEQWLLAILPVEAFGLDIGGSSSGDPSVLTAGGDAGIRQQFAARISDAPSLADWVVATAKESCGIDLEGGAVPICVDVDGIGWGVCGILKRRNVHVIEFRGNDPSEVDPKKYVNKRAEAYGELGRRLDPNGEWKDVPFMIEANGYIREELRAPQKVHPAGDGLRFAITPKRRHSGMRDDVETVHEKLGRSPDYGDSAVYWYRALQVKGVSLSQFLDRGFF